MKIINLHNVEEVQLITVERGDTEFCVTYTRVNDELFELHFDNFNEEVCPRCGAYKGTGMSCSCEEDNNDFDTLPVDELVDILNAEAIASAGSIIKIDGKMVWWSIPDIE